ncbi:hypothetical protein LTR67_011293 [Exophiala xenobiotica]
MAATEFSKLPSFDSLENKRRFWGRAARQYRGMLSNPGHPGFGREAARHVIKSIPNYEGIAWDDEWHFNPQAGSQWDGFRHFSTISDDGQGHVFYGWHDFGRD